MSKCQSNVQLSIKIYVFIIWYRLWYKYVSINLITKPVLRKMKGSRNLFVKFYYTIIELLTSFQKTKIHKTFYI